MMVLKVVGSALEILASLGVSRMASHPYQLRVSTLEEWQRLLRHLAPLIEWRRLPLGKALQEASRGLPHLQGAMVELSRELEKPDTNFREAWDALLRRQAGVWEDDRAALTALGQVLGASEASFQRDHLIAARADLERLMGEARVRLAKDGRLFPVMISAAGVMVVIMAL